MSIDMSEAAELYSPAEDEEPDEKAKRLLIDRVRTVMEQERKMRKRIQLHARHISEADREYLTRYLRGQRELTCALIEDVSDDLPEFSFPTDKEW